MSHSLSGWELREIQRKLPAEYVIVVGAGVPAAIPDRMPENTWAFAVGVCAFRASGELALLAGRWIDSSDGTPDARQFDRETVVQIRDVSDDAVDATMMLSLAGRWRTAGFWPGLPRSAWPHIIARTAWAIGLLADPRA